jgi:hypothetical protein
MTSNFINKLSTQLPVVCVRRDPPDHLAFIPQPAAAVPGFGVGMEWTTQPVVKVLDIDGAPTRVAGYNVTLTVVGGTGFLIKDGWPVGSSITVATNNDGVASFTGLAYSKAESIRLEASVEPISWKGQSIQLSSIQTDLMTFPEYFPPSLCTLENVNWETADGGCRNNQADGLVWSHALVAAGTTTWYDAVWDSNIAGSMAQKDWQIGAGITHDWNVDPGDYPANSNNVCQKLWLNGYNDWRMPTGAEILQQLRLIANGGRDGLNHVNATYGNTSTYIWSADTHPTTKANAMMYFRSNGTSYGAGGYPKTYLNPTVLCVRDTN